MSIRTVLLGTGSCVPDFKLTNAMLEQLVDTSDEWIVKRTGIRERRIAMGKATWEIAFEAAKKALSDAGVAAEDLDLIITGTVTPDSYTPSVACVIQGKLGAKNAFAFDLSAACSGFVYSTDVADSYIRMGKAKRVLVVCAEVLSRLVDFTDRSTCCIFGDGAAAAVYGASETEEGILATHMAADGTMGEALNAGALPVEQDPLSGSREFSSSYRFVKMAGNDIFRFTANAVPETIESVLGRAGKTAADVDWFILHQANDRILQMIAKRYGLASEKVYVNIDRFGNTSSASVPLCLDEMRGKGLLKKGQLAVLCGFGGGLTYGSVLIRI